MHHLFNISPTLTLSTLKAISCPTLYTWAMWQLLSWYLQILQEPAPAFLHSMAQSIMEPCTGVELMEALDQMLADTLVFVYIVFVTAKMEGTTPSYKQDLSRKCSAWKDFIFKPVS